MNGPQSCVEGICFVKDCRADDMSLFCPVAAGAHPDALLLFLEQTRPRSVGTLEALSVLSRNFQISSITEKTPELIKAVQKIAKSELQLLNVGESKVRKLFFGHL